MHATLAPVVTAPVHHRPVRIRKRIMLLALLPLAALAHRPVEVALRTSHIVGPLFHPVPAVGRPRDLAVLFLSGDAGFNRGSGPEIATRLAQDGYPVLGIDSLHFFATPRTAAEDDTLIATAARAALRWTGTHRFVVIGESFGADMVPTGVERLPRGLQNRLAGVTLLVPTQTVDFHISLREWLGWARPDADAATVARKLGDVPVLCISGAAESASLCPQLAMSTVTHRVLPGNHYLDHDYDRVATTIEAGIARATAKP